MRNDFAKIRGGTTPPNFSQKGVLAATPPDTAYDRVKSTEGEGCFGWKTPSPQSRSIHPLSLTSG